MNTVGFSLTSSEAIPPRSVVKRDVANTTCSVADAADADAVVGFCEDGAVGAGEIVNIIITGPCWGNAGGTIQAGDFLTVADDGEVVVADVGERIVGIAKEPSVDGANIRIFAHQVPAGAPEGGD